MFGLWSGDWGYCLGDFEDLIGILYQALRIWISNVSRQASAQKSKKEKVYLTPQPMGLEQITPNL
jgi:hypothetical protein